MFLIKHQVVKTATEKNIAKQESREGHAWVGRGACLDRPVGGASLSSYDSRKAGLSKHRQQSLRGIFHVTFRSRCCAPGFNKRSL